RCLLPLTSHKRVSEEEHEIILQAMTCGNIADRDTIQEMLREKQKKQGHRLSLVYNLAKEVQSRSAPPARPPRVPSAGDMGGRRPPGTLLKVPAVDTAITKSTPALQQICEEEEEEYEEEEGRPNAMERKSSSLNQEQMRA
ncbi:SNRK kinase, partial [Dromas ardeola]|nr:SNRK kinase [Dromas ardeola]